MMLLILVQRGKGGGLTGALGGMGGQSAFGAKAGDVFTRITVVTAIIWITLCMITIAAFNPPPSSAGLNQGDDIPAMSAGEEDETDDEESTEPSTDADDEVSVDEQLKKLVGDVGDESSNEETTDDESAESTEGEDASGENEGTGDSQEPDSEDSNTEESPESDDGK